MSIELYFKYLVANFTNKFMEKTINDEEVTFLLPEIVDILYETKEETERDLRELLHDD